LKQLISKVPITILIYRYRWYFPIYRPTSTSYS